MHDALRQDYPSFRLTRFRRIDPRFKSTQRASLAWLGEAHTQAEATAAGTSGDFDRPRFRTRLAALLDRVGCAPDKIASRGHELPDFLHTDWDRMAIYHVSRRPSGAGFSERTSFYARAASSILERLYGEEHEPPDDIVHVTCTGYVAPSAAQQLVNAKGWGMSTRVTHAYHMGCYAALPALRIAAGCLGLRRGRRADLVHTEICSLHLNPSMHAAEQLVIQSLFADGFIRYSLEHEGESRGPGLRILATREQIVPDSADAMSWQCSDWGMQMALARDVPGRISAVLVGFVRGLFAQAGLDPDADGRRVLFAVHPGGPRIIDETRQGLGLDEAQVSMSRSVLMDHGNMSSATLPHVWKRMTESPDIAHGTLIVSLAFGPGLTVCGGLFRKD